MKNTETIYKLSYFAADFLILFCLNALCFGFELCFWLWRWELKMPWWTTRGRWRSHRGWRWRSPWWVCTAVIGWWWWWRMWAQPLHVVVLVQELLLLDNPSRPFNSSPSLPPISKKNPHPPPPILSLLPPPPHQITKNPKPSHFFCCMHLSLSLSLCGDFV